MRWAGWIIVVAAAAAAALAPAAARRVLAVMMSALDSIARRRSLAIGCCGLLAAAGSISISAWKWPEPREHDEFSYLLAADTFAHGRLANPAHPMWRHFETFHVLQQPTYASKYPPAHGLFLAFGQVALGHPLAGVWLSGALMAAALCWALFAFLPARWALAGGLVAVAQFGVATYWTQSYWGGTVAALGGALVLGAVPRIVRTTRVRDSVLLAAGVAVLAASRPFEGLVAVLPAAAVLATWFVRCGAGTRRIALRRFVVPALAVVVPAAGWILADNRAVTGSAFRFPYSAYQDGYPFAPLFLWLDLQPAPAYRHAVIQQMSDALIEPYRAQQTLSGFLSEAGGKLLAYWRFFVAPYLSVAMLGIPCALRRRGVRLAAAMLAVMLFAILGETYYLHHYFAPMTAAIVLVLIAGLRELGAWRPRGTPIGPAIAWGVVVAVLATACSLSRSSHLPPSEWRRTAVIAELEKTGGRHLVIVRYGPRHVMNYEWVYNRADIEGSSIVWAHDLGADANRELLEWFRNREASLLEVGFNDDQPALTPFPR